MFVHIAAANNWQHQHQRHPSTHSNDLSFMISFLRVLWVSQDDETRWMGCDCVLLLFRVFISPLEHSLFFFFSFEVLLCEYVRMCICICVYRHNHKTCLDVYFLVIDTLLDGFFLFLSENFNVKQLNCCYFFQLFSSFSLFLLFRLNYIKTFRPK